MKQAGNLKGRGGGEAPTKGSEFPQLPLSPPSPPPAPADRALVARTRGKNTPHYKPDMVLAEVQPTYISGVHLTRTLSIF